VGRLWRSKRVLSCRGQTCVVCGRDLEDPVFVYKLVDVGSGEVVYVDDTCVSRFIHGAPNGATPSMGDVQWGRTRGATERCNPDFWRTPFGVREMEDEDGKG
jgi:hypothetical protein